MTAERPPCVGSGPLCNHHPAGFLRSVYRSGLGHLCNFYGVTLYRTKSRENSGRKGETPTRCAACRRDFPNEEVPK